MHARISRILLLLFCMLIVAGCAPAERIVIASAIGMVLSSPSAADGVKSAQLTDNQAVSPRLADPKSNSQHAYSPPAPNGVVAVRRIHLHEGPSYKFSTVGWLDQDDTFSVLARNASCDWVQVAQDQTVIGWLPLGDDKIKVDLNCPDLPAAVYRPRASVLLEDRSHRGSGTIRVQNESDRDSVVILVDQSDQTQLALYLRARDHYVFRTLPDGTYTIYFTSGTDWNGYGFTSSTTYARFEKPINYTTTSDAMTMWDISLQSLYGGNARTLAVREDAFPVIVR